MMKKRWLSLAVLCGICLTVPAMASTETPAYLYAEQVEADETGNGTGISETADRLEESEADKTEYTYELDNTPATEKTESANGLETTDGADETDGISPADEHPESVSAASANAFSDTEEQEQTDDIAENSVSANQTENEGNDDDNKEEDSYQAQESTNANGLKVIANPLWEKSTTGNVYKLVKTKSSQEKTVYYTLSDGVLQLGTDPGYYYAFDRKGNLITSGKVINNIRYYFTPASQAVKDSGSVTPNQTTLGRAVQNRWVKVNNRWYYFNALGQQDTSKTGLQKINGNYYYLNSSCAPTVNKWLKQRNGAWWYFGKTGKYNSKRIHSQKINGSYYYLNKKGIPFKNCFKTVKKNKYYYGASGKRASYTGWKSIKKEFYYFGKNHNVIVKTGWQTIQGKSYYFSSKGVMYAKRWATIGSSRYYFKASGAMATGWSKIDGTYYYFKNSGTLERNTIAKQGNNYYFVTLQGTRGRNILDGVGVNSAMSSDAKLRACFNYVINHCRYMGGQLWPPQGWEPYHAYKMLTTRLGNCYDFAAAFCYLAKAVGYEDMICISGQCASASGGYTPHSWCEYRGMVYDPEISYANGLYLYNVSYGQLPFGYIR